MFVSEMRLLNALFLFDFIIQYSHSHVYQRKNAASGYLVIRHNTNASLPSKKEIDPLDYLKKYGYLSLKSTNNTNIDPNAPRTMIHDKNQSIEFQEQADQIQTSISLTVYLNSNQAVKHWDKSELTFTVKKLTPDMDHQLVMSSITRAFKDWSDVTHFQFSLVDEDQDPDLVLSFEEDDHLDGYPFDGIGGELAHAFYPTDGRIHFDEAEYFTENSTDGVNLRIMAAHEIGHAIGLEHNFEPASIMYPEYMGFVENFTLSEYDKQMVKRVFNLTDDQIRDAKTNKLANSTTKKTQIYVLYKNKEKSDRLIWVSKTPCSKPFQSIFLSPKNSLFVITNSSTLWDFNSNQNYWTSYKLSDVYQGLENGARGGFRCKNNITWFFKEKTVWGYRNHVLLPDFPALLKFSHPQPDFNYNLIEKNRSLFLFQKSKLNQGFYFDTETVTLQTDQPYFMSDLFPGIPKSIDSSVYLNGLYYFFKGIWAYRFDPESNKVKPRDPKLKSEIFGPCKNKKLIESDF